MKTYSTPTLVTHGSLVSMTGDFGTSGADDVYLQPNGEDDPTRDNTGSIDSCAQEADNTTGGLKCICEDEGNC